MTTVQHIIALLKERRAFPRHSPDWQYRTNAAWKLLQMARGVPSKDWTDYPNLRPQDEHAH